MSRDWQVLIFRKKTNQGIVLIISKVYMADFDHDALGRCFKIYQSTIIIRIFLYIIFVIDHYFY